MEQQISKDDNNLLYFQVISTFCLGVLTSPWNKEFILIIISIFIFEFFIYMFTTANKYKIINRIMVILFYLIGFFVGKWIVNDYLYNSDYI